MQNIIIISFACEGFMPQTKSYSLQFIVLTLFMLMTHFNNFPPIRIFCVLFYDLTSVVSSVQSFSGHLFAEVSLRLCIFLAVVTRLAKEDIYTSSLSINNGIIYY